MLKESGEEKDRKGGGVVIEGDLWQAEVCEENVGDEVNWNCRTRVADPKSLKEKKNNIFQGQTIDDRTIQGSNFDFDNQCTFCFDTLTYDSQYQAE